MIKFKQLLAIFIHPSSDFAWKETSIFKLSEYIPHLACVLLHASCVPAPASGFRGTLSARLRARVSSIHIYIYIYMGENFFEGYQKIDHSPPEVAAKQGSETGVPK